MKKFVITKPSGISGVCVLGTGPTKAAALTDAYGPKPWSDYTKKSAKSADIVELTEDEITALHEASNNR
jgi:hypothetical protein